jgi:hypothetical protein
MLEQLAIRSVVIPLVVSLLAMLGILCLLPKGRWTGWGVAVAVLLGFIAAEYATFGFRKLWPADVTRRLPIGLALYVLAEGLLSGMSFLLASSGRWRWVGGLRWLPYAACLCVMAYPLLERFPARETVPLVAIWFVSVGVTARYRSIPATWLWGLAWAGCLLAMGGGVLIGGSLSLAQSAFALAAGQVGVVLGCLLLSRSIETGSSIAVVSLGTVSLANLLVAYAGFFAELPVGAMWWLTLLPIVLWGIANAAQVISSWWPKVLGLVVLAGLAGGAMWASKAWQPQMEVPPPSDASAYGY